MAGPYAIELFGSFRNYSDSEIHDLLNILENFGKPALSEFAAKGGPLVIFEFERSAFARNFFRKLASMRFQQERERLVRLFSRMRRNTELLFVFDIKSTEVQLTLKATNMVATEGGLRKLYEATERAEIICAQSKVDLLLAQYVSSKGRWMFRLRRLD
jgi:hypothetical protein